HGPCGGLGRRRACPGWSKADGVSAWPESTAEAFDPQCGNRVLPAGWPDLDHPSFQGSTVPRAGPTARRRQGRLRPLARIPAFLLHASAPSDHAHLRLASAGGNDTRADRTSATASGRPPYDLARLVAEPNAR